MKKIKDTGVKHATAYPIPKSATFKSKPQMPAHTTHSRTSKAKGK